MFQLSKLQFWSKEEIERLISPEWSFCLFIVVVKPVMDLDQRMKLIFLETWRLHGCGNQGSSERTCLPWFDLLFTSVF